MAGFFDYPGDEDEAADQDVVLLPHWGDEQWGLLLDHTSARITRDGEHLITAGDSGRWLYIVAEGSYEIVAGSGRRAKVVGTVGPGEVVGEVAFLDGGVTSADVISRGEGEALRLGMDGFEAFATQHPALGRDLLFGIGRIVAQRLRATTALVVAR